MDEFKYYAYRCYWEGWYQTSGRPSAVSCHLQCPANACFDRMNKRGREEEADGVGLDYLQKLDEAMDEIFAADDAAKSTWMKVANDWKVPNSVVACLHQLAPLCKIYTDLGLEQSPPSPSFVVRLSSESDYTEENAPVAADMLLKILKAGCFVRLFQLHGQH